MGKYREWQPISTYPMTGPVLEVEVRLANNQTYSKAHYACGDGDGLQPAFDGWFVPSGERSYREIPKPTYWRLPAPPAEGGE